MVRVPVAAGVWSTWKRYCDTAGVSMGRAISVLIEAELAAAVAAPGSVPVPVFSGEAHARLEEFEEEVARRERDVEAAGHGRALEIDLRRRERAQARVRQPGLLPGAPRPVAAPARVGRNQPCPCGSGRKHKHCHGQPDAQEGCSQIMSG